MGGGGVQDGNPSHPPPSPSGGFRTWVIKRLLKVAGLGQIRGSTTWWWVPKSPMDHTWQSREWLCADLVHNSHFSANSSMKDPLSRRHFIPEATSPWRVVIKHKNKTDHSNTQWTVSPLLFSPTKILLHIVCIFNIFSADWGCNSRLL